MGFVRRLCAACTAFAIVTSACSPTPEDHAGPVTETISTAPVIDSGPTPESTNSGAATVEELGELLGLSAPLLDTLVVEAVGSAIVVERWPEPSNEASVTPATRVVTDVAIGDMAALAVRHEMTEGRAGIPAAGDSDWSIEVLDTGDVLGVVSLALRRDGAVSDVYMMGLDGTFVGTHDNDGTWTATVRDLRRDGSTEVTELRPTGSGIAADSAVSGLASPAGRSGSVGTLRRPAQVDDRDTLGWYCGPLTGAPRGLGLLNAALDTFEAAVNDYLPRSEEFLRSISELIAAVDVVSNVVSGSQSLTAGAVQRELVKKVQLLGSGISDTASVLTAGVSGDRPQASSALDKLIGIGAGIATGSLAFGIEAAMTGLLLELQFALLGATAVLDLARGGLDDLRDVLGRVPSIRSALPNIVEGVNGFTDARLVLATLHADALRAIHRTHAPLRVDHADTHDFGGPNASPLYAYYSNCLSNTPGTMDDEMSVRVLELNQPLRTIEEYLVLRVVSGCPDDPCRLDLIEFGRPPREVTLGGSELVKIDEIAPNCSEPIEEYWSVRRARPDELTEVGPALAVGLAVLRPLSRIVVEVTSPSACNPTTLPPRPRCETGDNGVEICLGEQSEVTLVDSGETCVVDEPPVPPGCYLRAPDGDR